jgi:hypothetical protein
VGTALALSLAACGGAEKKAAEKPAATVDAAAAGEAAGKAVSGFITSVQGGDGAAACAFLTDVEQKIFVTNAAEIRPKLDTATCPSVVESYKKNSGSKVHLFSGELQSVIVTGDFASGNWKYAGNVGDQNVLLEKTAKGWQMGRDANDFPTSLLHFFDEG